MITQLDVASLGGEPVQIFMFLLLTLFVLY